MDSAAGRSAGTVVKAQLVRRCGAGSLSAVSELTSSWVSVVARNVTRSRILPTSKTNAENSTASPTLIPAGRHVTLRMNRDG